MLITKVKKSTRTQNPKVGSTSILDRLSNPALPVESIPVQSKRKYRSSFFFRLDGNPLEKERRKALTEKPEVPRSERALDERADKYKKELPASMDDKIREVREFMLSEINPLVLAAISGTEQAFNVLGKATGSEVERELQRKVQTMLQKGINIRLSRFIAEYLGLRQKDAATLLERSPPANIVFPALGEVKPENPIGDRREKAGHRK